MGSRGSSPSRGFQEVDQVLAHNLRLLLVRPVTGAIHHTDALEVRKARLAGSQGTAWDAIGAPILHSGDKLRRDIDGPP